jgi:glycosyltransferase involved in cell wall biosynthesis
VDVTRLWLSSSDGQNLFRWSYDNPQIGEAVARRIAEHRPDVVHVISGYLVGRPALAAARAAGVPTVLTLMEFYFLCWRLNLLRPTNRLCSGPESAEKCTACWFEQKRRFKWADRIAPRALELFWSRLPHGDVFESVARQVASRQESLKEALTWADVVISPSRTMLEAFERHGYPVGQFVAMRQGLGNPIRSAPRPRRDSSLLRLGCFGQIKPHKGIDLLIDAVRRMLREGRSVTLDIRGAEHEDAGYVHRLKQKTAGSPEIRWHGAYTAEECWDALAQIDALVVPSRWLENSPNVILEAFTMRVPVVATRLGGMAELVAHDTSGLLFTLNDAEDLYRQLRRLSDEPHLVERLSANAPPVRTLDDEMREVVGLYERLLTRLSE